MNIQHKNCYVYGIWQYRAEVKETLTKKKSFQTLLKDDQILGGKYNALKIRIQSFKLKIQ